MKGLLAVIGVAGIACALSGAWAVRRRVRRLRRKAAMQEPFPEPWHQVLVDNMAVYAVLPDPLRRDLQQNIQAFLAETPFEGCGGLEITDEIRVTIAAQACLLLLGRPNEGFPALTSVLVYPDAYVAGGKSLMGGESDETSVRLGESWVRGVVVLSWNSVRRGAMNRHDGHNVTVHEFAHQLDQEDGAGDGAPPLRERAAYATWASAFSEAFADLHRALENNRKTVIDAYGATNPAEFFAVATETFFEKPKQLAERHPEVYDALLDFYQVDPKSWG